MRKKTNQYLIIIFIIFLNACDQKKNKYDLNTSFGLKNIQKLIKTEYDPNKRFTSLMFNSKYYDNDLSKIGASFYESERFFLDKLTYRDSKVFKLSQLGYDIQKEALENHIIHQTQIKNFPIQIIPTSITTAKEFIGKEYKEYLLLKWEFFADGKKNITSKFLLGATNAKPGTLKNSTNKSQLYDLYFLKLDENGKVSFN